MPRDSIDPETLAAFVDGRLSADERARVLTVLARSDDAYDDLVESAAILNELGDAASGATDAAAPARPVAPGPVERRRPTGGRGLFLVAPLLAAGIALVVLTVGRARPEDDTAVRVARALAPAREAAAGVAALYGSGWDQPTWSAVRGGEGSLPPHAVAFRLGARVTELELAFAAGDSTAIARATDRVARLAAELPGGAATAARVELIAARGATTAPSDRAAIAREARALSGAPEWFDAGAWTDAARIAASTGRVDFFAADGEPMAELRRVIGALDARPGGSAETAALRERLRALAARPVPTREQLPAVSAALDSTMRDVGR